MAADSIGGGPAAGLTTKPAPADPAASGPAGAEPKGEVNFQLLLAGALLLVAAFVWRTMIFHEVKQGTFAHILMLAWIPLVAVCLGTWWRLRWAFEWSVLVNGIGAGYAAYLQVVQQRPGAMWAAGFHGCALVLTGMNFDSFHAPAPAQGAAPGAGPGPSPGGRPGATEPDSLGAWLRENFEAIVIAFVMALIIRCFCVEVFKIPTGSMEPTLMGEHPGEDGDRIMVNKFLLLFDPVQRFDVIVFKYPLDTSRNFIKRVVGIGPEFLKVKDGDIYTRPLAGGVFKLEKRDRDVQESIWLPVYAAEFAHNEVLASYWETRARGCQLEGGRLRVPAPPAGESARFRYKGTVVDSANNQVGDVRLSFTVTPEPGTGVVWAQLQNGSHVADLELGVGEGAHSFVKYSNTGTRGAPHVEEVKAHLTAGQPAAVAFMIYDGRVCLKVDGGWAADTYDYLTQENLIDSLDGAARQIAFGLRGVGATFDGLAIHRDIFYQAKGSLPEDGIKIPAGKYFVIGDNAQNSKDSRLWNIVSVTKRSGQVVRGDADERRDEGDRLLIKDIYGVEHHIPRGEVASETPRAAYPFVDESELVGKAFFVWWPPHRMKLIR